jgi:hypothetical protein
MLRAVGDAVEVQWSPPLWGDVMRPSCLLRWSVLLLFAASAGCESTNKGKIEGTQWTSLSGEVKGISVHADQFFLSFRQDGTLSFRVNGQQYTGKYTLSWGDRVNMHLDRALPNGTEFTDQIVIKGDRLTMTDPDGTQLTFRRWGK